MDSSIKLATGETFIIEVDDLDPKIHIGKRVNNEFVFAQNPEYVFEILNRFERKDKLVVDEYRRKLTVTEFKELLNELEHNTEYVNSWFC